MGAGDRALFANELTTLDYAIRKGKKAEMSPGDCKMLYNKTYSVKAMSGQCQQRINSLEVYFSMFEYQFTAEYSSSTRFAISIYALQLNSKFNQPKKSQPCLLQSALYCYAQQNITYRISPIDYHQFWQLSIHASGVGASRRVIASSS
ncbi:hypothetical protein Tsp_07521 [Trichinella spiralis]|uniref:hypothetical protein n=1 Tax=Trichinella spiralis TaxID=6334 RepID=UPI0001EFB3AC|nr:hypothetical protein Tsp_07521 [Trichinella spiralis]